MQVIREVAKRIHSHYYCEGAYMSGKEIWNSPGKKEPPEGMIRVKDESSRLIVEGLVMTFFTNVQLKNGDV